MNILLDTNVICGLINPADTHHDAAYEMMYDKVSDDIIIPAIVMAETLITNQKEKEVIRECKKLCGSFLAIGQKELEILSTFPKTLRKNLKAVDCIIMAMALSHDAELITFDKKLLKAYKSLKK